MVAGRGGGAEEQEKGKENYEVAISYLNENEN